MDSLLDLSLEELLSIELRSASLNSTTLANTASWITVLDEKSWRRRGARRTFDALTAQPATQVMPHVAGGEAVVVRGYTRTTSNRGLAILWDDVPLTDFARGGPSTSIPNINLFTLSGIDYTQGPGSALHGSDAFHGVVALRSFASQSGRSAATLIAGSDGYYDAGIRDSAALGKGHYASISLAANGQSSQDLGYAQRNPLTNEILTRERPERYDSATATLFLGSDPKSDTAYQLSYYNHVDDNYGFVGLGTRFAPARDEADQNTAFQMGRLSVTHRFQSNGSLEFRAYYWDLKNDIDFNLALGGGSILAVQSQNYDQYRYGAQAIYRDEISALDTRWALAIGYDKMSVYSAFSSLQAQSGSVLQEGPDAIDGSEREIDSATFEADTGFGDEQWLLVWGARLDNYSDFGDQLSPRIGLIYHPAHSQSIKLLYSEAFRAPTANELYSSSTLTMGNPDLKPETNNTVELIWLHQTSSATTQVSLYHARWREGIVTITEPNDNISQYQNQEHNESRGFLISHAHQWNAWQLDVNGSWVMSENKSRDEDYSAFPRYIINLGVGYSAASVNTDFYLQQYLMLDVAAEVGGHSGASEDMLPNYWRTDLTATWYAQKQLEVMLVVRNLFDRNNQFPSITSNGGVEDERFSISAGLRYNFD